MKVCGKDSVQFRSMRSEEVCVLFVCLCGIGVDTFLPHLPEAGTTEAIIEEHFPTGEQRL